MLQQEMFQCSRLHTEIRPARRSWEGALEKGDKKFVRVGLNFVGKQEQGVPIWQKLFHLAEGELFLQLE